MRGSQPNVGSRLHRDLSGLNQRAPEPIQAVKQKQPGRAHERLRLRDPNLGTMVVAKRLCRPLGCFPTCNLDEGFDCGSSDPQGHCAKAGDDAGEGRDAIAWLGKDVRIGEAGTIAARHKNVTYCHIVTAGAA
jgi:hypothetical protein